MSVKYKTKTDEIPEVSKTVELLDKKTVDVGCNWANAWLAGIHEYGCTIKVTPKMRAWFIAQGCPLKKTTTEIVIPERSFLRNGHDQNAERVISQTERAVIQVIDKAMTVDDLLDFCGEQMATAIKNYARDLSSPPNSKFTTDRKGSSNPLVDTGQMIESITWGDKL